MSQATDAYTGSVHVDITIKGTTYVDWDGKVPPDAVANEVATSACAQLRELGVDIQAVEFSLYAARP